MPQQGLIVQPPAARGGATVVTQVTTNVPQTVEELVGLREKRNEISSQLVSAQNRRNTLAAQLATADPAARPGIQDRLRVLDDRLVSLEQELDKTGQLLMNVPPALLAQSSVAPRVWDRLDNKIVPLAGILGSLVLLPLAIGALRLMWKRASGPARPALDASASQRLEMLQHAVDTIAIEVERISEGQRYVTRVMNERGLEAGAAEPIVRKQAERSELR
jgi:hypothetical protein